MESKDMKSNSPDGPGEPLQADWSDADHPTTDIVEAVAAATGRQTSELDPIQEYVDGDALETLLTKASTTVNVSFVYDEAQVRASSDGSINVWTE